MGTKNAPGDFDCYANAAPDEPMFILLGRDPDGATLVRLWADLREARRDGGSEKIANARAIADQMETWCREKAGRTPSTTTYPSRLTFGQQLEQAKGYCLKRIVEGGSGENALQHASAYRELCQAGEI